MSTLDHMPHAKTLDVGSVARELSADTGNAKARKMMRPVVVQPPQKPGRESVRVGKYNVLLPEKAERWDLGTNVDVVAYCEALGVSYAWAFARHRNGKIIRDRMRALSRQRVWAAMRDDGITFTAIAEACGMDHTTIHYGFTKYKEQQ